MLTTNSLDDFPDLKVANLHVKISKGFLSVASLSRKISNIYCAILV